VSTARSIMAVVLLLAAVAPAGAQQDARATTLQRAQQELTSGRRAEAKRLLGDAAERFRSVQALLLLSRVQSEDGDAAGALDSLRKARALAPNSEDVLSAFAQMSLAAGAPIPAVLALEALERMSPGVMQYHYLAGVARLRVGDRVRAVTALSAAERLDPNRAQTLLALGIAHNSLQQYADARSVLARAAELDSGNADTLAALAEAEQGLGELDAASTHAQQVLATVPQHATANMVAGLVAMDRSHYADARAALERAAQTDPLLLKAHYQLSLACARLGDEAAAGMHLERYRQVMRDVQRMIEELKMATGPTATDAVRR